MNTPAKAKPVDAVQPRRAIPEDRMKDAAYVLGNVLHVTLEDDQVIEAAGPQDVVRWALIGTKIAVGQWLLITNDAGSFRRIMVADQVHSSPGTGVRALVLDDLVPPKFFDKSSDAVVASGSWYVRYFGSHRRWGIVSPGGIVRRDQINTEAEATNLMHLEARNPKPR
jgi:hypothetical protein